MRGIIHELQKNHQSWREHVVNCQMKDKYFSEDKDYTLQDYLEISRTLSLYNLTCIITFAITIPRNLCIHGQPSTTLLYQLNPASLQRNLRVQKNCYFEIIEANRKLLKLTPFL